MARVNVDILGISKLKWTGMGEFNSDDHYIYYCGQESLRRNGVAIVVNKRVWNAVLGCNLKNDRMISLHFQSMHSGYKYSEQIIAMHFTIICVFEFIDIYFICQEGAPWNSVVWHVSSKLCVQWCQVGTLKLTVVGAFISQKSGN